MKKYLCLVIIIMCFMIQPLYATSSPKQSFHYSIEENMLEDYQPIYIDINADTHDLLIPGEIFHQQIKIKNNLPYDVQLQNVIIHTTDELQNQVTFLLGAESTELDSYISSYNNLQSPTHQYLEKTISQQRILSQQEINIDVVYQLLSSYTSQVPLSSIQLEFQFIPIMIKGFAFADMNHSGIQDQGDHALSDMQVKLWSGEDLLATTSTNQDGYYQFMYQKLDQKSYIEFQNKEGYALTKVVDDMKDGNCFTMQDNRLQYHILSDLASTQQYSLGLIESTYHIHYDKNDGQKNTLFQNQSYTYKSSVTVLAGLEREGYKFNGWNSQSDGKGAHYQSGDVFEMPMQDITLYAVWEPIQQNLSLPVKKNVSLFEVETSDDTHILILSLMCLLGMGGMIVAKSLRKKELR